MTAFGPTLTRLKRGRKNLDGRRGKDMIPPLRKKKQNCSGEMCRRVVCKVEKPGRRASKKKKEITSHLLRGRKGETFQGKGATQKKGGINWKTPESKGYFEREYR